MRFDSKASKSSSFLNYGSTDGGLQLDPRSDPSPCLTSDPWSLSLTSPPLPFSSGAQYFHGPTYMTAAEIASSSQQMFYKQEVFVSLLEDTHPMVFVTGKCCVLDYTDYCSRE